MDDFYRDTLLDHYKHPQFSGFLDPHDGHYADDNPLCGDRVEITFRLDAAGHICAAAFQGKGCVISQATADLLLESVLGQTPAQVLQLGKDDVLGLLGIELGPVRLKCALLPLKVLQAGVRALPAEPPT
jgi:nitrogen fixation NifU-like protein